MKRVEALLRTLWEKREYANNVIYCAQEELDELYSGFGNIRAEYKSEYEEKLYLDNDRAISMMDMLDRRIFNVVRRYSNIEKRLSEVESEFLTMVDTYYMQFGIIVEIGGLKITYDVYDNDGTIEWYLNKISEK